MFSIKSSNRVLLVHVYRIICYKFIFLTELSNDFSELYIKNFGWHTLEQNPRFATDAAMKLEPLK
jgi:hypothetical protein